ncbi:MAG: class I SAM-dependent methyltransferase [Acidimicrobiia bacterium]
MGLETALMSNGDVFADIAGKYDRINRVLSLGRDDNWRRQVVDRLPDGSILDVGAGTGAANGAFAGRGVVALDPSAAMLGRNDASHRVVATGERLPFVSEVFDAVFSAFVFRNLASVDATVSEMARVLKPGGKAGVVDLGRPPGKLASRLHRAGTAVVLGGVGVAAGARSEYRYLHRSLDKLPGPEALFADGALRLEEVWRMGPLGFVYGAILGHR